MFENREDEYLKATRDAQVNIHTDKGIFRGLVLIWNIFLLASFVFIGYLGFNYLNNKELPIFLSKNSADDSTLPISTQTVQTAVMGVSDTKSDSEYLEMLNAMEMEIVETTSKKEVNVNEAIDDIINTSTIKDDSLYTQAISKELEEIERDNNIYNQKSRVVFVEKGDTLGSLSTKYYGNSTEFNKIIEANEKLTKDSHIIHVGQKLNIPY